MPKMPVDYTREVIKLAAVKKPVEVPSETDWNATESDIGLKFPIDFKTLVSSLGSGQFGVGLSLRNPKSTSVYLALSRASLIHYQEPLVTAKLDRLSGITLFPSPNGLVEIGGIDRQRFLLKPDRTGRKLSQMVWWDIDIDEAKELTMSFSQFIHDLYLGRIDEAWADELRQYIWRNGTSPFFTSGAGRSA